MAITVKRHPGSRPEAKTDRNTEIVARYARGDVTLEALAEEYGVTRERIRQLVTKAKLKARQKDIQRRLDEKPSRGTKRML